ncbi:hypothetical protein ACFQ38_09115 [Sporosarcina contaminans]|uniref:Phenylalanyl-tRNA synthetase subunit beta n=1 Tax=Sporosarcina contaminans TaxID=633403 RepID=A0ABW3TXX4_9BACL
MRFIKFLIGVVIFIGLIGFGVYYFGTKILADQVMDKVEVELEASGQMEAIKQEVQNNLEVKKFLEEGKSVDEAKLPFKTKDEAMRVLLKKFSLSELNDIQIKVRSGMTTEEQQQLFADLQNRLTEDEMTALKLLAYKELYE